MKLYYKKFCTKLIRPLPSPPKLPGIKGKILGHLAEMLQVSKLKNENAGMGLVYLHQEWYKKAKSKTVIVDMFRTKTVLCGEPEVYKEILGSKQDGFTNGLDFKIVFGYFFRTSIIVVDGEQWMRIRKVVQRAINRQNLDNVIPIMFSTIEKLFSQNEVNKMRTSDMTNRITFDVFHRVMYGWDPKSVEFNPDATEILNSCNIIAHAIGNRNMLPIEILWKIPTKSNREIDKAVEKLKKFVTNFIKEERELKLREQNVEKKNKNTLLDAMIMASEFGEDGGMTNEELYDQICTLFFGAYDTTSTTLKFLLNYLARYPNIQEKLRSCIIEKFPNGIDELEKSNLTSIEEINYLRFFIDEVNRLHALAPFFSRDCIKDTVVGNYEIKKGTRVIIDSKAVGQDPQFWNGQTDLSEFRPERWEEFSPSKMQSPMPFGFGGRICPGRKIALAEMKVFLVIILCRYQVKLRKPQEPIELQMNIGISLKEDNGNIDFTKLK